MRNIEKLTKLIAICEDLVDDDTIDFEYNFRREFARVVRLAKDELLSK